jgi:AraC-like DNA-binding protein
MSTPLLLDQPDPRDPSRSRRLRFTEAAESFVVFSPRTPADEAWRASIGTIALAAGFDSRNGFDRAFRRHCGATPGALRRQGR